MILGYVIILTEELMHMFSKIISFTTSSVSAFTFNSNYHYISKNVSRKYFFIKHTPIISALFTVFFTTVYVNYYYSKLLCRIMLSTGNIQNTTSFFSTTLAPEVDSVLNQ